MTSPTRFSRDAHADQARISQEHISRQIRIVAVQEGSGDRRDVENILDVSHRLPAVLVGEDQRQIGCRIRADLVDGILEHARPLLRLPVEIAMQRRRPIRRQRHGVFGRKRCGEMWRVGKLITAEILVEALTVIGRRSAESKPIVTG